LFVAKVQIRHIVCCRSVLGQTGVPGSLIVAKVQIRHIDNELKIIRFFFFFEL